MRGGPSRRPQAEPADEPTSTPKSATARQRRPTDGRNHAAAHWRVVSERLRLPLGPTRRRSCGACFRLATSIRRSADPLLLCADLRARTGLVASSAPTATAETPYPRFAGLSSARATYSSPPRSRTASAPPIPQSTTARSQSRYWPLRLKRSRRRAVARPHGKRQSLQRTDRSDRRQLEASGAGTCPDRTGS